MRKARDLAANPACTISVRLDGIDLSKLSLKATTDAEGRFRLTGFLAWVAWLFIHILYLIGFKNRFFVFVQWVWSYLFSKRGARLITHREWKQPH